MAQTHSAAAAVALAVRAPHPGHRWAAPGPTAAAVTLTERAVFSRPLGGQAKLFYYLEIAARIQYSGQLVRNHGMQITPKHHADTLFK